MATSRSGIPLTTAASLWAVSGIGLACGIAFYEGAIDATLIVIIILFIFTKFEAKLLKRSGNGNQSKQDREID